MRRQEVRWRGLRAWEYSAGGSAVVVVPSRGGKIASLRDAGGREWLAQGDGRAPAGAGTPFESAEMCGWDECVPTIEPSSTPGGGWAADHGDVWDRPWREIGVDRLAVDVPSVGARFERGVAIAEDGALTLSYRVEAGPAGASVLWAAHPLFRAGAGARLSLDVRSPLWMVSGSDARREPGRPQDVLNAARAPGDAVKYYAGPADDPRWARIELAGGGGVHLAWRGEAIRTVGVWIDRGRFASEDVVALEPSTGWYDSLERAERSGRVLRLAPRQGVEWSISVTPLVTPPI